MKDRSNKAYVLKGVGQVRAHYWSTCLACMRPGLNPQHLKIKKQKWCILFFSQFVGGVSPMDMYLTGHTVNIVSVSSLPFGKRLKLRNRISSLPYNLTSLKIKRITV